MDTFELAVNLPVLKSPCSQRHIVDKCTLRKKYSRIAQKLELQDSDGKLNRVFDVPLLTHSSGWLFIKDSTAHAWLPGDGHVSSCKNLLGFQPS